MNKQQIIDDIFNIVTDQSVTSDSRVDQNWLNYKIDQVRAQLIIADYNKNGIMRQEWLTDLGFVPFWRVNFANNPDITFCECDISQGFVPKVVSFTAEGGNPDIGFPMIMSACGKKKYYQKSFEQWRDIPKEHIYSKFNYYYRVDTAMYVNKQVEKLRMIAVLESPEDGYIIQSKPIASGDLVAGQTYIVKYKQITYNFITLAVNDTFIAQVGLNTYSGTGTVYLADQLQELSRTEPYPISSDMARQIVIEVCTKEFKIAESEIPDTLNDDQDDEVKTKAVQPIQPN